MDALPGGDVVAGDAAWAPFVLAAEAFEEAMGQLPQRRRVGGGGEFRGLNRSRCHMEFIRQCRKDKMAKLTFKKRGAYKHLTDAWGSCRLRSGDRARPRC